MKFSRLSLTNFQAHKSLVVDFSPTITTIVGATDKGKSAILRALRWVCLNDFAGDDFVHHDTKKAEVVLEVRHQKEAHQIKRVRGTSGTPNTYALNGDEFKSFRSGVPDGVQEILCLNPVNFQAQHDSPFWFNETPGEVSRQLNAVIDLSIIDKALYHMGSETRRAQERKTLAEERLTALKEDYTKAKAHEGRIKAFEKLQELNERQRQTKKTLNRLETLLGEIRSNRVKFLVAKATAGESLLVLAKTAITKQASFARLENLLDDITRERKAAKPPPDFSVVQRAFDKSNELASKVLKLSDLISDIDAADAQIERNKSNLQKAETRFHTQVKDQNCPLCGNRIQ